MGKLNWGRRACGVFLLWATTAISSPAQTPTTLVNFNGTNGDSAGMDMTLIQGTDGNFYGTTSLGGANNAGTVFKVTAGGKLTTLYSFCSQTNCTDGENPAAGLVQATSGDFYGTTNLGGANNAGTVFKITAGGKLTTLYSFCSQTNCTDGDRPIAGLVQATNGDFYGTTNQGGNGNGNGTVFKITAGGKLTTLYTFCSQTNCTDGAFPFDALVQATDGNFYGTTQNGANGNGTVFKITPAGKLTTLVAVSGWPIGTLVQATDGNFYGTTAFGGTIFEVTPGGKLTTLVTVGGYPYAGLVQATDGSFYGTTYVGGANGKGTVFKMTPSRALTALYTFCSQTNCTDGAYPLAGLMQATDGNFYGTTIAGGTSNACTGGCGTIYSLSVGLGRFVETKPTAGKEGTKIGILGQGFSSSSVVKFGGTKATTIVRSGTTFITATVPAGALTGAVTVTTGSTTLTSAQTFKVKPTITSFAPPSGPVGTSVSINGTGLMQATRVAFNGTSASFTVNSDILITATVPTGATTGKIAVTTKGGSASSGTSFTVN
jgi:uncharacterized repeat protein (TIGR03803 family)